MMCWCSSPEDMIEETTTITTSVLGAQDDFLTGAHPSMMDS